MGFDMYLFDANEPELVTIVKLSCTTNFVINVYTFSKLRFAYLGSYLIFFCSFFNPRPSTLEIMKYHTHVIVSIPPVVGIGDPVW